jgi:hypothetical protein
MFGVGIDAPGTDVGGVELDVDVAGTLLVGDGGDPICWAPGMRL